MNISSLKNIFLADKNNCNCLKFKTIENSTELEKRIKSTNKLESKFKLLATNENLGVKLFECEKCKQLWQESLSWTHGNAKYIFKVPKIDIENWKKSPFIEPHKIFSFTGIIKMFFERTIFEEKSEKCIKESCNNQSIKLSNNCILHHMKSLGINTEIPEEYRWFDPYKKENIIINMDIIKKHPNYIELKK